MSSSNNLSKTFVKSIGTTIVHKINNKEKIETNYTRKTFLCVKDKKMKLNY